MLPAQCSLHSRQCLPSRQEKDIQATRSEVLHTDHPASLHSPARDNHIVDEFTINHGEQDGNYL